MTQPGRAPDQQGAPVERNETPENPNFGPQRFGIVRGDPNDPKYGQPVQQNPNMGAEGPFLSGDPNDPKYGQPVQQNPGRGDPNDPKYGQPAERNPGRGDPNDPKYGTPGERRETPENPNFGPQRPGIVRGDPNDPKYGQPVKDNPDMGLEPGDPGYGPQRPLPGDPNDPKWRPGIGVVSPEPTTPPGDGSTPPADGQEPPANAPEPPPVNDVEPIYEGPGFDDLANAPIFSDETMEGVYNQRMRNDMLNQQGRIFGQQAANERAALRGAQAAGNVGAGSVAGMRGLAQAGESARRQLGEAGLGIEAENAQSQFGLRREGDLMRYGTAKEGAAMGWDAAIQDRRRYEDRGWQAEDTQAQYDFQKWLTSEQQGESAKERNLRRELGKMAAEGQLDAQTQAMTGRLLGSLGGEFANYALDWLSSLWK
jgi:hypothetical protein